MRSTVGTELYPVANPGDPVRSVDNICRHLARAPGTTVTVDE
ncbi:hypothetical protein ACFLX9_00155 [Chloroflexota bacterium]